MRRRQLRARVSTIFQYLLIHGRPTNNIIGDSEQAGLAGLSDTTSKKVRLDLKGKRPAGDTYDNIASKRIHLGSEINPSLLDAAKRARERRDEILQKITAINQPSIPDGKTFDKAAARL